MMPNQPVTRRELRRVLRTMEAVLLVLVVVLGGLGWWSIHLQEQHGAEVEAIRRQRVVSITESCQDQNRRNGELSRFLEGLPVPKGQTHSRKKLLNEFVNALAPHTDCHALLVKRTGG